MTPEKTLLSFPPHFIRHIVLMCCKDFWATLKSDGGGGEGYPIRPFTIVLTQNWGN